MVNLCSTKALIYLRGSSVAVDGAAEATTGVGRGKNHGARRGVVPFGNASTKVPPGRVRVLGILA